ncbi:MAG: competence/damage-inducible protein A [Candidatus Limnocylindrales bacterium]
MARPILTAELLAVGTELTTGGTRDSNGGELAAGLTELGVAVRRITLLPDDLDDVREAIEAALGRSDLTITTGGLGPTPDDLTREAIAAVCGEQVVVDAELEEELRGLFERRGIVMPTGNRKQAWLIPSATALRNGQGTAPGWWVERPAGRLIVALPGPPRELRPMWRDVVLPRLRERGIGADRASTTWRLAGVGESVVADLIGEGVLRAANPQVATYAREDGVDVRISAVAAGGRPARDLVAEMEAALAASLGPHRFASGGETWVDALGARLAQRTVASVEIGTGARLVALLGDAAWLRYAEQVAPGSSPDRTHPDLRDLAMRVREVAGTDVGLAVRARPRRGDLAVAIAGASAEGTWRVTRTAFLTDDQGRRRAAVLACLELWRRL